MSIERSITRAGVGLGFDEIEGATNCYGTELT
jgi:hypothetical protein